MRLKNYNILIILIILLFATNVLLANNEIDSLEKHCNNLNDKDKIRTFLNLAELNEKISVHKSIYYAYSALIYSKKLYYFDGEIQAYIYLAHINFVLGKNEEGNNAAKEALELSTKYKIKKYLPKYNYVLGCYYSSLSDFSLALNYFREGLSVSKETNDWETEGLIIRDIGKIFFVWKNHNNALIYLNNANEIFIKNNSLINIAIVKGLIGYIYSKQNNEKKAFEYFNQAIDMNKKYGYNLNLGRIYEFIGDDFINKECYQQALKYYINSKNIFISLPDNQLSGEILTKIAFCYSKIGDINKSLEYDFKALNSRINYGDQVYIGSSYNNIGTDFLKMNKLDSAEKYFKKGLESAIESKKLDFQVNAYKNLSAIYEKNGNYKVSLDYYKKFDILSDSTYSITKYKQILEFQSKIDYEHQKTELSNFEFKKQKNILLYILIIAIIFIILVIIISFLYFSKHRDNKRLDEKTKELNYALKELSLNKEELAKLNRELENRVAERTKELFSEIEQRKFAEESLVILNKELEDAYEKSEIAFKREKELNVLKTNFIQMISHEFRSPLTIISSSSELIKSYLQFGQIDKVDRMIYNIITSVNDISTFIEDVFMYNKLEEQGITPTIHKVNLSTICKKTVDDFNKKIIFDKNITLIDNNLEIYIQSDINFLQQILNRLIKNAIKFSSDNSDISLELIKNIDNIKLIINDNGWNINPNEQKNIFDAFHREGENIGIIPGIGLGPAIVNKLVEIMAWNIEFDSELGKSATFSITIPLEN